MLSRSADENMQHKESEDDNVRFMLSLCKYCKRCETFGVKSQREECLVLLFTHVCDLWCEISLLVFGHKELDCMDPANYNVKPTVDQ